MFTVKGLISELNGTQGLAVQQGFSEMIFKTSATSMRKEWASREEKILRNKYGEKEVKKIAEVLGRTLSSVYSKAERLGLKYNKIERLKKQGISDISAKVLTSEDELKRMYWEKKMSLGDIANKLRVGKMTVHRHFEKLGIPTRDKIEASVEKNKINPDLSSSTDLAYVLGVLKGDGSVFFKKDGGGSVTLNVTSRVFSESFSRSLKEIGMNPNVYEVGPYSQNRKKKHRASAKSIEFVKWYKSLSLSDISSLLNRKELELCFIRGFYESEGNNQYNQSEKRWRIRIYNTNEEIITFVDTLLNRNGFNFNLNEEEREKRKNLFILCSGRINQNSKFLQKISPCIKNKIHREERTLEKWSNEKVINRLIEEAEKQGHSPIVRDTPKDLVEATKRYFGSWNKAKEEASLKTFRGFS